MTVPPLLLGDFHLMGWKGDTTDEQISFKASGLTVLTEHNEVCDLRSSPNQWIVLIAFVISDHYEKSSRPKARPTKTGCEFSVAIAEGAIHMEIPCRELKMERNGSAVIEAIK